MRWLAVILLPAVLGAATGTTLARLCPEEPVTVTAPLPVAAPRPDFAPQVAETEAALAATTDPAERARLLAALAIIHTDAGDFDAAEAAARQRLDGATEPIERHAAARGLAEVWLARGSLAEETATLEAGLGTDARDEDRAALLLLGEIYHGLRPDTARWIEVHERLRALDPDDPVLFRRLRAGYRLAGNPSALTRMHMEVYRTTGDARLRKEAVGSMVDLWYEFQQTQEVIRTMEMGRAKVPEDPETLDFLAELYWRELDRHLEAAAAVYETLVRLHQDDLRVHQRLVEVYYRAKRNPDAARLAREILARFPEARYDAFMSLLGACVAGKDKAAFLTEAEAFLEAFGGEPRPYGRVAVLANRLRDEGGDEALSRYAVEVCDRALAGPARAGAEAPYLSHAVATLLLAKARALVRLGRREEGRALVRRVAQEGGSADLRGAAAEAERVLFPPAGPPDGEAALDGSPPPR